MAEDRTTAHGEPDDGEPGDGEQQPGARRVSRRRRTAGLVVGATLLVLGGTYVALNPSALGPLWDTRSVLATFAVVAGVSLVAWARTVRTTD